MMVLAQDIVAAAQAPVPMGMAGAGGAGALDPPPSHGLIDLASLQAGSAPGASSGAHALALVPSTQQQQEQPLYRTRARCDMRDVPIEELELALLEVRPACEASQLTWLGLPWRTGAGPATPPYARVHTTACCLQDWVEDTEAMATANELTEYQKFLQVSAKACCARGWCAAPCRLCGPVHDLGTTGCLGHALVTPSLAAAALSRCTRWMTACPTTMTTMTRSLCCTWMTCLLTRRRGHTCR